MKALVETNDREIFEGLVGAAGSEGLEEKQFVTDRVELLLRTYKVYGLHTKAKTRAYLGGKFKVVLGLPAEGGDILGQGLLEELAQAVDGRQH